MATALLPTPDRATLGAMAAMIGIGGLNFVAVRVGSAELPPFTGGAARLAVAALVFLALLLLFRVPVPRGGALTGVGLYGVLGLGLAYALAYHALAELSAAVAALVMSLVPLLTVLFAAAHRLEVLHLRTVLGGLLAVAGVAVVLSDRFTLAGSPISLLAMFGAAVAASESAVLVKRFPRTHPLALNAFGMVVGAAILGIGMVVAGERPALPTLPATWISYVYLVVIGTVVLFSVYLFALRRWTASGVAYAFVLAPFVAAPAGALLTGEGIGPTFVAGLVLVLAGVYVGALAAARKGGRGMPPSVARSVALCAEQGPLAKCL